MLLVLHLHYARHSEETKFFFKEWVIYFSNLFWKIQQLINLLFTVMWVCITVVKPLLPSRAEWGWYSSFLPMLSSLHNRDPEINKNVLKGTFLMNYLKYMNYFPFLMFSIDINAFFWEQKARHLWEES